jgi:dienelactone hydrolase
MRLIASAVLALQGLVATWGASALAAAAPTLAVSPPEALMDDPIRIVLSGVGPATEVAIRAELVDDSGKRFESSGAYFADDNGQVDLGKTASVAGTYDGVDSGGLLWSMRPGSASADLNVYLQSMARDPALSTEPNLDTRKPFEVRFHAEQGGREIASASQSRRWLGSQVTVREVAEGAIRGVLYTPTSAGLHPGVIILTGSGGGIDREQAPLLASRGFAVLALGYFSYKDRPAFPANLPIEYFRDAIQWLHKELGHDRIALLGTSRGTEATLLTAATYPDLLKAVVVIVPGPMATAGFDDQHGVNVSMWSYQGQPVPYAPMPPLPPIPEIRKEHSMPGNPLLQTPLYISMWDANGAAERYGIAVERIRSPILLLSGAADQIWPSAIGADRIVTRLRQHGYRFPLTDLRYQGVGHSLWEVPNSVASLSTLYFNRGLGCFVASGGVPRLNAAASRDAWQNLLTFLNRSLNAR